MMVLVKNYIILRIENHKQFLSPSWKYSSIEDKKRREYLKI